MSNLYLDWSVKHVEEIDGGYAFLVSSIRTPARFTVTRIDVEWQCHCTEERDVGCVHIQRAYAYYLNMLKRAEDMKKQLKRMMESKNDSPLFENKRNIKLE